ncbi:MAG TPA: hypothetical protein DEO94_02960 [Cyanobacteria bacterium UBA11991]|nr:hypothetical protein [Cyanobacteriota bacterium]MDY6359039.1 hypothetical protein [Cyanobacteriota bacterium]MDY6363481.1 hypothetical protein [Cyanobacteriota bacterium]MDY6382672.1 hypothetical protein [Cyanobacteriota bacterium]HCB11103.1 hypothetical protein [Cyanobacteria bacterium UBA11991]
MSIAEKLKKTLSTDYVVNREALQQKSSASYMSKAPLSSSIPKIIAKPQRENKFPDMTTEIIDKINKTPYWHEYSEEAKEKMVSKYFDTKIKCSRYEGLKYSLADKLFFIEDVLKSVIA